MAIVHNRAGEAMDWSKAWNAMDYDLILQILEAHPDGIGHDDFVAAYEVLYEQTHAGNPWQLSGVRSQYTGVHVPGSSK